MIPFDEFKKLELRVAKILKAERVAGSGKLIRFELDAGDRDEAELPLMRQIVAGIGKEYEPEALVGREIVIIANLEPKTFTLRQSSGQVVLESNGMLLAAHGEGERPVLLVPDTNVAPGSFIS